MSPMWVCRVSVCNVGAVKGVFSGLGCSVADASALPLPFDADADAIVGGCWLAENCVEVVVGTSIVSGMVDLYTFGRLESAAAGTEFCSATRCLKFSCDWTFGMVLKFVVCVRMFEVRWSSMSCDCG